MTTHPPRIGARAPYLTQATADTPRGWYTTPDGRETWWGGPETGWVSLPDIEQPTAVLNMPPPVIAAPARRTATTAHLVVTVLTCGLWAPFWLATELITAAINKRQQRRLEQAVRQQ